MKNQSKHHYYILRKTGFILLLLFPLFSVFAQNGEMNAFIDDLMSQMTQAISKL